MTTSESQRADRGATWTRILLVVGVIALALALWEWIWDRTDWLASPGTTWQALIETVQKGETYGNLWATARRLIIGLLIGYTVGVTIALLMHQSRWWRRFAAPYVFVGISTPGLAWALISLMIFGLSELGLYLAVAGVTFPFVVVSLISGLETLDPALAEMTRVFRFSWYERMRHQAMPEIAPHLFAAFRNVHALAWKVVVLAELFSAQSGIGFQYKRAFAYFSTERLLVWAFFFIAMVMLVEYGILRPFERAVFRWRS